MREMIKMIRIRINIETTIRSRISQASCDPSISNCWQVSEVERDQDQDQNQAVFRSNLSCEAKQLIGEVNWVARTSSLDDTRSPTDDCFNVQETFYPKSCDPQKFENKTGSSPSELFILGSLKHSQMGSSWTETCVFLIGNTYCVYHQVIPESRG